jgi:hypothetical protein
MSIATLRRQLDRIRADLDGDCDCGNPPMVLCASGEAPPQCERCGKPEVVEVEEIVVGPDGNPS